MLDISAGGLDATTARKSGVLEGVRATRIEAAARPGGREEEGGGERVGGSDNSSTNAWKDYATFCFPRQALSGEASKTPPRTTESDTVPPFSFFLSQFILSK